MNRSCILSILFALPACAGGDSNPSGGNQDASQFDSSTAEASSDDGSAREASPSIDGMAAEPDGEASDGGCPTSWSVAPVVDPSIAVPDGGGGVLLHAVGVGTQNYACNAATTDAGAPYLWTLVTPEATLNDCHDAVIGHHFASEAGAGFPEWQTNDGTYVIGQKHLPTFSPDGGAGSIPWLLLRAVDAGGPGPLSQTAYVQRLYTDGGIAPSAACNASNLGATSNVPYTADYYFFGP